MAVLDDESLIGQVLDQRYLIGELIARGGMSSVFRATDQRLERVVAVKIMHPSDNSVMTPDAFSREAKFAARLNHRGIVSVYDQGTDGDLVYLVMEYVPGKTLRDVIRDEAPMAPRRALSWLEPVLEALNAAHAAGLVHRDMKPENVLISDAGEVKVADFGLTRQAAVDQRTSKVLVGTVSYLAPEVISQDKVDTRADVYACGAMLFEMLTGRKPHAADTPIAIAHKHVTTDVEPPSSIIANIPPYVDALVLRALARDRAQRSPDARTFLHQVRMVQQALAAGLTEDSELTADLLPGAGPTPATPPVFPGADADSSPTGLITPVSADDATATTLIGSATTVIGPVAGSGSGAGSEPTRTWSNPPELPPATSENRRPRRGKLLALIVLLAFLFAGVLGWWFALGRWDQTPDLTDLPRDEAVAMLEAAGFSAEFTPDAYSETVAKGSVIETSPAAHARILPGATITLTISKGQERYKVPKLKGKTLDEAETILGSLNLHVGNTTDDWHDSVAQGSVIRSSSHKIGDKVKRDTAIDLVVSKGPAPVDLVDFTNKKAKTAIKELEELGLKVKVTEEYDEVVAEGVVISQSPETGTAHRGDTIELVVSKGTELFAVPNMGGMTAKQAEAALTKANLRLKAKYGFFTNRDKARAHRQDPSPGTQLRRGTTVTVWFSD